MGFPLEWRATHKILYRRLDKLVEVMRVFKQQDGSFGEWPEKKNLPRFVDRFGKIHYLGSGRVLMPIPGVEVRARPTYTPPPPPQQPEVDSHGSAVTEGPESVLSEQPSAGARPCVTISASAAACVYMAAASPEWECPHGMAMANTGDNATLIYWDRDTNTKQVHVCSIDSKTHRQTVVDVRIAESLTCELW